MSKSVKHSISLSKLTDTKLTTLVGLQNGGTTRSAIIDSLIRKEYYNLQLREKRQHKKMEITNGQS